MQIKIVGLTQPINTDTTVDEFIAYVARVSNPANQNNTLTAPRLLRYLVKNKHWSPFEMVNVVVEVNTTRDIGRQILRHRSFAFQEFSQRYADPTDPDAGLGFVTREARWQDTKNRQNSVEIDISDQEQVEIATQWIAYQTAIINLAEKAYTWAIEKGIAKEQARAVLPEGLTLSRMYMQGSLRSWIHYCDLRMANGTQKEHRIIATEIWKELVLVFPSLRDLEIGKGEKV